MSSMNSLNLRGTDTVAPAVKNFFVPEEQLGATVESSYVFVAICFMFALKGLGHPETSLRGNLSGMIGMLCAIAVTMWTPAFNGEYVKAFVCFAVAAVIGISIASKAQMIMMPQMVAGFHAMVGFAAILVAFARYYDFRQSDVMNGAHLCETMIGVFFGAVTLTGSIVACGKLHGVISSKPVILPFRHFANALALLASVCLTVGICLVEQASFLGQLCLWTEAVISMFLGWHLVMSIGGADMPVVVSMLNSYSGWTTVAAGFMLDNNLLIISGSLIGSSGAILSYIMCKGMNRSFFSVILGGFGVEEGTHVQTRGEHTETTVDEVVSELVRAKSVVIVPGYGMAVARCQQSVASIADTLRSMGINVRFAIHPVAGRLPGHMNVLLAEANVPYQIVEEMEKINFDNIDVSLVCGANDIVNPLACEDLSSPIGGMPVLEVWKAKRCVVMKRSMATGYAGVDNPLFYKENSRMLFGNAKNRSQELLAGIQLHIGEREVKAAEGLTASLLSRQEVETVRKVKEYPPAVKTIGVLNESLLTKGETRVALSPNIIGKLREMQFAIVVEKDAGKKASFPDRFYATEGCRLADSAEDVVAEADIIIMISNLTDDVADKLKANQTVIAYMSPAFNKELIEKLALKCVTALAMDAVPRITRAQKLDTLSSMANMAGYKAVVEAFHHLPRFSRGLTTAAGQVPPAKVLVIGAGVAGLSAVGTARSLGAVVMANDTRSVVKEQVESMGAEFIEVPFKEEGEGAGGYARAMSEKFKLAQKKLYSDVCTDVDVVITTAQIPGETAPLLIPAEVVRGMKPGSVIVDLAAVQGGNVELTRKDEVYVDVESGVTIVGLTNMACFMPAQASELYSANVAQLLKHLKDASNMDALVDKPDDVVGPVRVSYKGEVTWTPPKAPVAAASVTPQQKLADSPVQQTSRKPSAASEWVKFIATFVVLTLIFLELGVVGDMKTVEHFMAFAMAVVIGYFLVWNVDHALHTPLMSVTNAISGIIVLGALVQLSATNSFAVGCALLGTFCASVNIFGGFFITQKMLGMFIK